MDRGKGKLVAEEDKEKDEERSGESTSHSSSIGIRINADEGKKEGEEESQSSDKSALDMSSLESALPDKEADDADAGKREFMSPHNFFCGEKSMKRSPFSCLGDASNHNGNSENPKSSATQAQHPRDDLTRFIIEDWFSLTRSSGESFPGSNIENPASSAFPPLDPAPWHPPVRSPVRSPVRTPVRSSSPSGYFTYMRRWFRVTVTNDAAAGADSDGSRRRPNSSSTDLQSASAGADSDDSRRPNSSSTYLQSASAGADSDGSRRPNSSSTDLQSASASADSDGSRRPNSSSTDLQSASAGSDSDDSRKA